MRPISPVVFAFAASSLLLAAVVAAHDDDATLMRLARGPSTIDEQIAHMLERAGIAQACGRPVEADSLLDCVARVAPESELLARLRARVALDRDRPEAALRALAACPARALAQDPLIPWIHAEALVRLSRLDEAAAVMDQAVARFGYANPEQALARADVATRRPGEGIAGAIAQLDRALARWPGAWPLVSRALDLERAAGRYDAALARIAALSAASPARPELFALRGDVLVAAGRRLEACEAWSIALELLQLQGIHRPADRALADALAARLRTRPNPSPVAGGSP